MHIAVVIPAFRDEVAAHFATKAYQHSVSGRARMPVIFDLGSWECVKAAT